LIYFFLFPEITFKNSFLRMQEFREKADLLAQAKPSSAESGSTKDDASVVAVAGSGSVGSGSKAYYSERDEEGEEELVVVNTMRTASATAPLDPAAAAGDSKSSAPETEVARAEAKTGGIAAASAPSSSGGAKAQSADAAVAGLSASFGAASMNAAAGKGLSPLKPLGGPRQALPHHIPKMESLGSKLDDIRRNMGDEVRFFV
jgi:hypothetical protein